MILLTGNTNNNTMSINNEPGNNSALSKSFIRKFEGIYPIALGLLYIASCILVIYIDIKKIHNSIFAIILVIGYLV